MKADSTIAEDRPILKFPDDFLWGVGVSAYQNEGNTPSTQWGEFEDAGGTVTGEKCGRAADWWRNAEQDFDRARDLGVKSLRMGVSWARIEPEEGRFDERAILRYREMLEGLLQRGIRPMICLHHFAHPLWFERSGAFTSRKSPEQFLSFARHTVRKLGDLCQDWLTVNEPNVFANLSYVLGEHPPGKRGAWIAYLKTLGNMALAHLLSYHVIHELVPNARASFHQHYMRFAPHDPGKRMDRFVARMTNAAFNDAFIKMVADGEIPFAHRLLNRSLDGLKGSWDFIPISVYGKFGVAHDPWGFKSSFMRRITPIGPGVRSGDVAPNGEDLYGQLYPEGIRDVVERFAHLKKPYFMLESGCQDRDDKVRPWVLVKGAKVVHDLIREGYTIHGYHHWTLVDNFEWKFGWSLRFGLIELDVETQERRPRRSSELFREIATNNALSGRMVREYVPDAYEEIFG